MKGRKTKRKSERKLFFFKNYNYISINGKKISITKKVQPGVSIRGFNRRSDNDRTESVNVDGP